MKISSLFRGAYLKVGDLNGDSKTLTISSVQVEEVGVDKQEKGVLRFEEVDQGLVLNKTNADTIVEALGDEADAWVGQQITLRCDKTRYNGKTVDCIRVAVPDELPV